MPRIAPHRTARAQEMATSKDEQFYMTLTTFQVEDCLFRIPRQSLISQSRIFRDMFSLPMSGDVEGSRDDNPIHLYGIKKSEFKRFLEVLFRGACETANGCSTFDMWHPVVKLARMWEFEEIHDYAVKNMPYDRMTPTEKVGFAIQNDIRPWLLPALNELAKRDEPLGNSDLELLGPELTLKVATVRESLRFNKYQNGLTSGVRDAKNVDFTPVIKRVFQI